MRKFRDLKIAQKHLGPPTAVLVASAIFVCGTLIASAPRAAPRPDNPNPTAQSQIEAPASLIEAANQSKSSPTPNSTEPTKQLLVRFESDSAKLAYLEANELTEADLKSLPSLRAYLVNHRNSPILTLGTTTYTNHRYQALLTPADPLYSLEWHIPQVNASTSWNHQIGNSSTTVAVIDTGFALAHQDLEGRWATNSSENGATSQEGSAPNCTSRSLTLDKNCNNYDDDSDGFTDNYLGWDFAHDTPDVSAGKDYPELSDTASHGTMVSGIIAASANNGVGIAGINWQGRILPLQALDDSGVGYTVSVALAIRYAVDHGAKVINMSLGTQADDPLVSEQIDYAHSQGVVVVAAAGNDGCDCILYPARYSSVIAVGATTSTNQRAYFSSYGQSLDLVAPGYNLCSIAWSAENPTTQTACNLAGTSFASPIVAGAVSLMLAQNPHLSPDQVTSTLRGTASKLTGMNGYYFSPQYGYGLANIYAAISDVSITSPIGSPLSTDRITQSELSSELSNYNLDKYNSTCRSSIQNANCSYRAINATTNEIVVLATDIPPDGTSSFQATLAGSGLPSGSWIFQTILQTNGVQSLAREKYVIITD